MYSVKCRYMLSISMLRNEHGLSAALLHIGTYQIEKNSIEDLKLLQHLTHPKKSFFK